MASFRHQRAEGSLKREITRILTEEISDPTVVGVYVTKLDLSPDKQSARVLVSSLESGGGQDPPDDAIRALQHASGFIQRSLGARLKMRNVPRLRFEHDRAKQAEERVDTLLKRIRKRSSGGGTLILACMLFATSTHAEQKLERFEAATDVMGSEFRIACYAPTTARAAGAVTAAFGEVQRIDDFLSNYKPDSELSRINREAHDRAVTISTEMSDVLEACKRYHKLSDGAFDITVGALVESWGFFRGNGKMPNRWSIWLAQRKVGSQYLEIDRASQTVRLLRDGLSLDPGGIGKGYAVDRAAAVLREYDIEQALISAGTSSIYALGTPPGGAGGWPVKIRDPGDGSRSVAEVRLSNSSLSTSGSDEKFFEIDGKRYSHIIDPRTGRPAEGMRSASVISSRTIDSEAWATAIFVNGAEWTRKNRPANSRIFLCPVDEACGWLD